MSVGRGVRRVGGVRFGGHCRDVQHPVTLLDLIAANDLGFALARYLDVLDEAPTGSAPERRAFSVLQAARDELAAGGACHVDTIADAWHYDQQADLIDAVERERFEWLRLSVAVDNATRPDALSQGGVEELSAAVGGYAAAWMSVRDAAELTPG